MTQNECKKKGPQFVQLGHPRSGSTLLAMSLMQHPDINMFGEVFHAELNERKADHAAGVCRTIFYQDGDDAAEFLAKHVYYNNDDPTSANGFKLFYEHARDTDGARKAWDYLLGHTAIKIVHLTRSNLLECLVSYEVAKQTGTWHARTSDTVPAPTASFVLGRDLCHGYFDCVTSWRTWANSAFKQHQKLDLDYDADVCGNYDRTLERIFLFLGVEPYRSKIPSVRLQCRTISEQVTNYYDLKKYFRNTAYCDYFIE